MKAVAYTAYGPPEVLRMVDVPTPAVRPDEVLVRVRATTVTVGDTIMRSLRMPLPAWQKVMARLYLGWSRPKRTILGMELSGDVEAVGRNVTRFAPGDEVFASTFAVGFGGYAEYKCLPEDGVLALKPADLSYEQAAAVPGAGMTAWHCLGKAKIQPGQRVLVYGASGAVGTNAVQLAAHQLGASVTGVCRAANAELVESLGASRVLDYTRPDFDLGSGVYDVVFDAVGKLPPRQATRALKSGGMYVNVHTASGGADTLANLLAVKGAVEAGKLRPAIDRVYPFHDIVEAHRYVDMGRKRGNVAIDLLNRAHD
ncbi:MAG: NAD(P)-dependent alcohol dehydrogenase [Phycisphaerales bacterium]|nr:MAG: NAD(P)-dependent alcohol dehydrogenase [Phycisphaerales bacterium]